MQSTVESIYVGMIDVPRQELDIVTRQSKADAQPSFDIIAFLEVASSDRISRNGF